MKTTLTTKMMQSSTKCERLRPDSAPRDSTRLKVASSLMMKSQMTTRMVRMMVTSEMIRMMTKAVMQVTTTSDHSLLNKLVSLELVERIFADSKLDMSLGVLA